MSKCVVSTVAAVTALLLAPIAYAQVDGWDRPVPVPGKYAAPAGPAPKHDISGTWDPGNNGIQPMGAGAIPEDGKPGHQLSYTPAGLAKLNQTRPSNGSRTVLPADSNDPAWRCDPQGIPREDLFELRQTQILQAPDKIVILYEYGKIWRVIWTDGRAFPKDPEPRWFGYSVGKWVDDYTFVADTIGTDERTWIDRAGRPHSADLKVEETFHRVDSNTLEFSVKIDDPKMYTKPWMALDKLKFYARPSSFDVREMMCSPSELAEYDKFIGNPASNK